MTPQIIKNYKERCKMVKKRHHVVPSAKRGWIVRKGGALKASKTFNSKKDATKYARKVSKNQKSELIIHKKDGTINRKESYGRDPFTLKYKDTRKKQ